MAGVYLSEMTTNIYKSMKNIILTLLVGSSWFAQPADAQDQPKANDFSDRLQNLVHSASGAPEQPALQKFDLDFRGGSPRDLVSAIEKTTGKPVNAIIAKEDETVEIPAMKFKSITIPDLFRALSMASQRQERLGGNTYNTFYTFETQGQGENAIYYFRCRKPTPPQEFCRFYQLADPLQNYSIEDITTAIQTGWKMLGVKSPPQLKFHSETKLLIAVGQPEHLAIIDNVLMGLRHSSEPASGLSSAVKKDASSDKQ